MPTTTLEDFGHGVRAIGARTDPDGLAVDDLSAREDALVHHTLHAGVVKPTGSFEVTADGTSMAVTVGSGSAYTDLAAVESDQAQQPPYLVRLNDAGKSVTLDASGSQARVDALYLVVQDNTWDASGRALARIGYRKGDEGAGAPGPDAAWHAYLLLATVAVGAAVSTIAQADITDGRVPAGDWAPRGTVRPHATSMGAVPSGWVLADGTNGTPDLRDRFVVGAGGQYAEGATGGADTVTLSTAQMPSHNHSQGSAGDHSHGAGTLSADTAGSHDHNLRTRAVDGADADVLRMADNAAIFNTRDPIGADGAHGHSISGSTASQAGHTHSIGNTGGGSAHENRPPYWALVWIVHL